MPVAHPLSPATLFGAIGISVQRLTFRGDGPPPAASAWRGALGWALQRRTCVYENRGHRCPDCIMRHSCLYHLLYENRTTLPGLSTPPRAYALATPRPADGEMRVEIGLFGRMSDEGAVLSAALVEAAAAGVDTRGGKTRGELVRIERLVPPGRYRTVFEPGQDAAAPEATPLARFTSAPPPSPAWTVHIASPMRLSGRNGSQGGTDWRLAFQGLAIRLSALNVMNGGRRLDDDTWKGLMDFFSDSGIRDQRLRWQDRHRRTCRRRRRVPLGGVVGRITVEPPARLAEPWWGWWKAAGIFGLGKGTVQGNGRIYLRPARP